MTTEIYSPIKVSHQCEERVTYPPRGNITWLSRRVHQRASLMHFMVRVHIRNCPELSPRAQRCIMKRVCKQMAPSDGRTKLYGGNGRPWILAPEGAQKTLCYRIGARKIQGVILRLYSRGCRDYSQERGDPKVWVASWFILRSHPEQHSK